MTFTVQAKHIGDFNYHGECVIRDKHIEGMTFVWNQRPRESELAMLKHLVELHGAEAYDTWPNILVEVEENGDEPIAIPTSLTQEQAG